MTTNQPSVIKEMLGMGWLWFLALGIGLIILGALAISSAFLVTKAAVFLFGMLVFAAGIVQTVQVFWSRGWGPIIVHAICGIVYLLVGGLLMKDPVKGAIGLTLLLAAMFIAGGIMRIILAILLKKFGGWLWMFVSGIVSVILGIMIWSEWPISGVWIIGLFIGVELIMNGWSWVMIGIATRMVSNKIA